MVNSITPGATPSINMTWYTRDKTDVGIDFSTLGNKLEGRSTGFMNGQRDIWWHRNMNIRIRSVMTCL